MAFIPSPKALALHAQSRRKKLKLSQAEVGERVGLLQKTISAFENKPESTQLETLFRILSALEMDINLTTKESSAKNSNWKEEW